MAIAVSGGLQAGYGQFSAGLIISGLEHTN
jgi:hypothetical protein